jgi:hypothetical protein
MGAVSVFPTVTQAKSGVDNPTTRTNFVRIELLHEGLENFPSLHVDGVERVSANPRQGTVEVLADEHTDNLSGLSDASTILKFQQQVVVDSRRNRFGGEGTRTPQIEPSRFAQLTESYTQPELSATIQPGGSVRVSHENGFNTVGVDSENVVELPAREVTGREVIGDSFKTVTDQRTGDQVRIRDTGDVVTRRVVPKLSIKNHGQLDVSVTEVTNV